MEYKFARWGSLLQRRGITIRLRNAVINDWELCIWWPWNWALILITAPYTLYKLHRLRALDRRLKR
ncbi:hypothetical protein [Rhizobium sp. Nf11,1]|uniref:hypothetical protein n=1 Tax=Rhizobium sp. Nf11,1 TaxID=3404923 RepID=UPI003D3479C9